MGRLVLLILLIVAIWIVWKAFGPSSWQRNKAPEQPVIKGPDDDPEFLWELEKQRFKRQREQAREQERIRRQRQARDEGRIHEEDDQA